MKILFNNKEAMSIVDDSFVAEEPSVVKTVDYDGVWVQRFKLDDNNNVVDMYEGQSEADALESHRIANEAAALVRAKKSLINTVKNSAGMKISEMDWKITRATERDAVNGTNTLADVYAEREAIRTASDAKEVEINAATTQAELMAIDLTL